MQLARPFGRKFESWWVRRRTHGPGYLGYLKGRCSRGRHKTDRNLPAMCASRRPAWRPKRSTGKPLTEHRRLRCERLRRFDSGTQRFTAIKRPWGVTSRGCVQASRAKTARFFHGTRRRPPSSPKPHRPIRRNTCPTTSTVTRMRRDCDNDRRLCCSTEARLVVSSAADPPGPRGARAGGPGTMQPAGSRADTL